MLPILDSSSPSKGVCDMAGSHVRRHRILLNGNLLRAGLCLLVIGMSASCTSIRSLNDGVESLSGKSTGMCSEMLPGANGWTFRANEFLIKSEPRSNLQSLNGIFPSSDSPAYSTCAYVNKLWHNVILGEHALTATGNAAFMTTSDNVCSARPTINIHRYRGDWLLPEGNFKPTSTQIPEEYTDPTYSFYIGSHNASWITTPNAIEKNLLLLKEVIAKQCGTVPLRSEYQVDLLRCLDGRLDGEALTSSINIRHRKFIGARIIQTIVDRSRSFMMMPRELGPCLRWPQRGKKE